MSSFLICDVLVKDREALSEYLKLSEHTLAPYSGKFHVQAGKVQVIEGDWNPSVIIVAEFPNADLANSWYKSDEYSAALKVKSTAMNRNMILVDGIEKGA